jgi:hypothetical protein
MIVSVANIMGQTILLELSEIVRSFYIYVGAFIFVAFTSLLILTNMKDVIQDSKPVAPQHILKQTVELICTEPRILMGVFGEVCGRILIIACTTYTTLAVTDAFEL